MARNLEQFAKALSATGLMTPEEVTAFREAFPPPAGPLAVQQFAKDLVRQNKLTRFQASQIYVGVSENFVIGDYCILDKIGAGGMGQVFKAQHRRMKRLVALKLLPAKVTADAHANKRFQREVEAAARLVHPNIVTAYDAGKQGETSYLIMEYVDGADLASIVKQRGPLKCEVAVGFILQAAAGLEHAHAEGVIHRDIKPANLLVDKKGALKILDMGLARIDNPLAETQAGDQDLTNSGIIMGTIDYMSPEQALDTRKADQRADIYSLGCTLYFLVTGRKMYVGESVMQKLVQHREAPVPPLEPETDAPLPGLDDVFRKMVAKRPEDRFQTMGEVRAALQECVDGESVLAEEPRSAFARAGGDEDPLASFLSGMAGQSGLGLSGGSSLLSNRTSAMRAGETLNRRADQDTDLDSGSHPSSDSLSSGSQSVSSSISSASVRALKSNKPLVLGLSAAAALVLVSTAAFYVNSRPQADPVTQRPKKAKADEIVVKPDDKSLAVNNGATSVPPVVTPPVEATPFNPPQIVPKPLVPQPADPPTVEPPKTPPAPPVKPPVVASPATSRTLIVGVEPGQIQTLMKAVEQAKPGDTILIRHRGPLTLSPMNLTGKTPLTIAGDVQDGVDFWPIVKQKFPPSTPTDPAPKAPALLYGDHVDLTLRKVHLCAGGEPDKAGTLDAVFSLKSGRLELDQCTVTVGIQGTPVDPPGNPLPLVRTASSPTDRVEVALRGSFLRGLRLHGCVDAAGAGRIDVTAVQTSWAGGAAEWIAGRDVQGPVSVGLTQSTLYNIDGLLNWQTSVVEPPKEPLVRIQADRSLLVGSFGGKEPLLAWNADSSQADFPELVAAGWIAWEGAGNVFHRFPGYFKESKTKTLGNVSKWRALWGQSGAAVDREADPCFRVLPDVSTLQEAQARDFQPRFWRSKSRGKPTAEVEAGADAAQLPVALAAVFRRPVPAPDLAGKPRGAPRVLVVHKTAGPYKTLEAAFAKVQDEDVIEIADDAAYAPKRNFTTSPGDAVLASTVGNLTLRAADGASPVVVFAADQQTGQHVAPTWLNGVKAFFTAYQQNSLTIDGINFRLTTPSKDQQTILMYSQLAFARVTNCTFSLPTNQPPVKSSPSSLRICSIGHSCWLENTIHQGGDSNTAFVQYQDHHGGPTPALGLHVRNSLFAGLAIRQNVNNPDRKTMFDLQQNAFFGQTLVTLGQGKFSMFAADNLAVGPDAPFNIQIEGTLREAAKSGGRNALWTGTKAFNEQDRRAGVNALLPGGPLRTPPTFELASAKDPLRKFRLKRGQPAAGMAGDGGPAGVRFEYLPEFPADLGGQ